MYLLEVFQQMDDCSLTEKQWREKLIRVTDLCHFIKCYDPSIKIIDWRQHKINIVEDKGIKKGLFLCDLFYNTGHVPDASLYNFYYLSEFRKKYHINELWFAIVEEGMYNNIKGSNKFIEENNISALYDKVFHFNFSQSKIELLK